MSKVNDDKQKFCQLGDVATYVNGYAFKPADWGSEGLPIIRIQDLTGNSYQANYFSGEIDNRFRVYSGDILISWSASLGVFEWHGGDAVLNQHIFKVVFDKIEVDKRFFIHQLKMLLERFASEAHGATMKHLTRPVFNSLPFYAPPLMRQQKIASVLERVSNLITFKKQQLAKLDQLAKSRFIEMFGDPGSGESKWEKGNLGDYIEIIGGYAFKSEFFADNGIPVLRIGNINTGEFVNKNMVFWQEDVALSRYLVFPGDMVISLTGTVGKDDYGNICIVNDAFPRYYLNQRNAKLCIKKSFSVCFIAELMRFPIIKQQLTNINRGVRQANIANKDIAKLVIPISPLSLQNEFAVFVEQLDKSKVIYNKTYNVVEKLQIVV